MSAHHLAVTAAAILASTLLVLTHVLVLVDTIYHQINGRVKVCYSSFI